MKPNPRYDEVLDALQSGKSDLCGSWVGDCWRYQAITHPSGRYQGQSFRIDIFKLVDQKINPKGLTPIVRPQ